LLIGNIFGRPDVCKNVGTAKSVNRLLGVADEKQAFIGPVEKRIEYLVLDGIGVLEFVNQGGIELTPYRPG